MKRRKRVTDTDRLNWIIKNLWYAEQQLLDDCYFEHSSLRRAIDAAIKREGRHA